MGDRTIHISHLERVEAVPEGEKRHDTPGEERQARSGLGEGDGSLEAGISTHQRQRWLY